jgi:carotenoid phi-ring synthase / carotenoid chi-ring synthase
MEQHKPYDVIIVGAGIAGLSAALHLAERGLKPLILEGGERVGGRLAGMDPIDIKGWKLPLEHGVHGIWNSYVNFKSMLKRHEIVTNFIPARDEGWIHRDGKFIGRAPIGATIRNSLIPAPFHYIQLFLSPRFLRMLGLRDWISIFHVWSVLVMSIGIDPFIEDQPLEGLTFGKALKSWGPSFRSLFFGLTRNGLSTDPDEVPLAGFLAFLRFYTVMRRDAWKFDYLPDGGGEVCEKLTAKIMQRGGEVRFKSRVTRLEKDGDWIAHWESGSSPGTDSAPFLILASDSPAASSILKNSFPAESDALFFPRGLEHAVIRMWFDRAPRSGPEAGMFSGDFVMHNFFWLEKIYESYRKWGEATGGSCIEVHVYGPQSLLEQGDALLLTKVLTEFYRAFPELKGHLIAQNIQRNAAAHTLPALGMRGTHLGIETKWENLFCAGDWVSHAVPAFFLERACVTGLEAANRILSARELETWDAKTYPSAEPLAAWIEKRMRAGRARRRKKKG